RVPSIRVRVFAAGLEVQCPLASHHVDDLLLSQAIVNPLPAETEERPLIPQSTRVVDQVPYRNRMSEIRDEGQIGANVGIQIELTLAREKCERKCGELLGNTRDMEDCLRSDGHIVLEVSLTISAQMDRAPTFAYSNGHSGPSRAIQFFKQRINDFSCCINHC